MSRWMSLNALNLYQRLSEEDRYSAIEAYVRDRDPDGVVIQEVISDGDTRAAKAPGAEAALKRFADATGLRWDIDGEPLLALGGIIHHPAILYRDCAEIRPLAGSVHRLEREMAGMWHGTVSAVFELDGHPVRIGSTQLSPFDQRWNASDAAQLLRVFNTDGIPGLIGGDFNCVALEDPDPYDGMEWHPDFVYQLDADGRVDRQAAIRLERVGRMGDCARIVGAQWIPTTGHHPADNHPPRRIDRWHTTYHFPAAAVTGYRVADLAEIRFRGSFLSDHCPIEITLEPGALSR